MTTKPGCAAMPAVSILTWPVSRGGPHGLGYTVGLRLALCEDLPWSALRVSGRAKFLLG